MPRNASREQLYGSKDGRRVRIVEHTDIRRMLMNIKALAEGMRALVYKAYLMEDLSKAHSDPEGEKRRMKGWNCLLPWSRPTARTGFTK